jgi:hypothetical protein
MERSCANCCKSELMVKASLRLPYHTKPDGSCRLPCWHFFSSQLAISSAASKWRLTPPSRGPACGRPLTSNVRSQVTPSKASFLPQALLFALLVGPLVLLVEISSAARVEPSTPLAKSFKAEIEAALSAASGTKVNATCSMHGSISFGVSCRVPANVATNLVPQLLASGWSYTSDSTASETALRKENRRMSIASLVTANEVSIALRFVKS